MLLLPISIGNKQTTTLLDSGSALSIISLDFLLKSNPHITLKPIKINLVAANKTSIQVAGQCRLRINFGKFSLRVPFVVVDSPLSHQVILGSDWIMGTKADIITSDKTIRLPGHPAVEFTTTTMETKSHSITAVTVERPAVLYPAFMQSFEAGTGGIVVCKIKGQKVQDGSVVCIPTPNDQLDIAVTSYRNQVNLPFANFLKEDLTLWPNKPLARAIIFKAEEVEPNYVLPCNATTTNKYMVR